MPSGSRHSLKLPKPKQQPKEKWWIIRDILQERTRGSKIEYLVDWEDDPDTGEQYPPSWAPSEDITSKAIFDWRRKQEIQDRGDHATRSEQSESHSDIGEPEEEVAFTEVPPADSLDSSQPVQPPRRRKRHQLGRSAEQPDDLGNWDSEESDFNPRKRHCSEALSSVSSGSEVDTDAASDVIFNPLNSFFVAIPSKLACDPSEYISVSDSQGSSSLGTQSVSALEDEDNQVVLNENLSQRTIPDSQDYSAFDTQDSQLPRIQTAPSASNRAQIDADREISDSQKQSSLRTQLSQTTDSQPHLLGVQDHTSPFFVHRTPLQPSPSEPFQGHQQEPGLSGCIPSTQNSLGQTQGPETDSPSLASPELQRPSAELSAPESLQLLPQASISWAAPVLAREPTTEQYSVPASVSDRSIPSRQVDNLRPEDPAGHSPNNSSVEDYRRVSQRAETPIFLTQPTFDFDVSSSPSNRDTSAVVSGASEGRATQTANQDASGTKEIVTCSGTQSDDSQNTQLAQVVPPLPNISASQIASSSSTTEDLVPDTVRRKPLGKRRFSATSLGSSLLTSSKATPLSQPTNRPLETSQQYEDENSQGESFQTCLERRSHPPLLSASDNSQEVEVRPGRSTSLPPVMDTSAGGEPLSAIEELMRIQEAALQGTLTESSLNSSTYGAVQLREDGTSMADAGESHAFSESMANPSIHINSQPPIASDWNLQESVSSSTDLPVLSGAPAGPVNAAPIDDTPRTASMGEIFPASLMPPDAAEQLPITISPAEISRSIEPDDGLVPQHDDQPLDLLPEDDTTAGKSTASSPDVEDQYISGAPTAMDQSEYMVTVSFPANIRPLYLSTMTAYKREIEQFNQALQSDEGLPDQATVDAIGRLFGQLRDICDLPAFLDSASIDALSAIDLKKHATGTNSKCFFVGRFLERLQTSHKKILIVVRDINILGYLEAVVGTGEMAYSLKGLHELESQDEHSLLIVLLHSEQTFVDDLSDFDVVIGFDNGIMHTDILDRWAQMNGKRPMLIRLMTTCSIEHLELMMPAELEGLERQNALLIALFQSRSLIANDEQGEMIDHFTSLFASQAIDPDPSFGWEPEPIPSTVLDFYSSTQPQSQMPPTAEELTNRKRKADEGPQPVTKRLRLSPSPGRAADDVDASVRSHLNPDPSRLHIQTTQDHLNSLSVKVSDLEHQLTEKTTLESNLRKHITNLSKRVKSHDRTINIIQERHMAALRERSKFEAERDEAKQNEEKAWDKSRDWQNKAQTFEEELKKKSATLEQALLNAGTVATETFKQKTEELERSVAKIAELEKKLESRDSELGYARDVYQTANQANSELARENRELKEQVAALQKSAVGSLGQIQNINAGDQVKEMQRQIAETQAITKDREKELARVEKELRMLKNGRRETRQQSVPRSPRLGMMSPRTGRAAGGSASRGTSPTPYESSGGTPVPGLQFFSTPANNGRWGHLRD
ncbi:hypothetical protein EsH8_III_000539 [Colletotrichum jinshuiense]